MALRLGQEQAVAGARRRKRRGADQSAKPVERGGDVGVTIADLRSRPI